MKKIDGYSLTMAALLALPYLAAPFSPEFDASDAPDAPTMASIAAASTSDITVVFDTILDVEIDVAPHAEIAPTVSSPRVV